MTKRKDRTLFVHKLFSLKDMEYSLMLRLSSVRKQITCCKLSISKIDSATRKREVKK